MPEPATLDDIWQSYSEIFRSTNLPDDHIYELARLCFFNGADAVIKLVLMSSTQGGGALRDMLMRSAASCTFVLGTLEDIDTPKDAVEIN